MQKRTRQSARREKSAGAIVYRMEQEKPRYLLLHYPSGSKATREYWDLPKGHIEKGETEQDAARREIAEETGIADVEFQKGFRESIHYYFQFGERRVSKTVVFFLAQTKRKDVQISHEHLGFTWLPYEDALAKLTFENARRVLRGAHAYLKENQEG